METLRLTWAGSLWRGEVDMVSFVVFPAFSYNEGGGRFKATLLGCTAKDRRGEKNGVVVQAPSTENSNAERRAETQKCEQSKAQRLAETEVMARGL
jgi:hypothetical protein